MSVALLRDPSKPHDILDDIESSYWSLLYGALHKFNHQRDFDMEMFDEQKPDKKDGKIVYVGGKAKRDALGEMPNLVSFNSVPLNTLILSMAEQFHEYYTLEQSVRNNKAKKLADTQSEETGDDDEPEATILREEPLPPVSHSHTKQKVVDDEKLEKQLEELRAKLSQPSFWMAMFDHVLEQKGWKLDAADVDRYPPCTAKQAAQNTAKSQLTSHLTGEQLASQDEEVFEHKLKVAEVAAMKTAADIGAQQEQENIDSDDDDELESCINVEDLEERMDPMDAEFRPVSIRDIGATQLLASSSSSSAVPSGTRRPPPASGMLTSPHHPPPASDSVFSIQSTSSIRIKRSINEIATDAGPSEEPAEVPPPAKKSRSRSRHMPAPTTRVTRSSSRLAQPPQEAVVAATITKGKGKGKESRVRGAPRKARSGDFSATTSRPRREGLRPKTTSTHHD